MPKNTAPLPDWELVLSSAAWLQRILPDAVLVGGTASAIYAEHRVSRDADHVLTDLRHRFDEVLAELESAAGWKRARVQRPVQILGSLDGIETGIRQLMRDEPLETAVVDHHGARITHMSDDYEVVKGDTADWWRLVIGAASVTNPADDKASVAAH